MQMAMRLPEFHLLMINMRTTYRTIQLLVKVQTDFIVLISIPRRKCRFLMDTNMPAMFALMPTIIQYLKMKLQPLRERISKNPTRLQMEIIFLRVKWMPLCMINISSMMIMPAIFLMPPMAMSLAL